MLMIDDEATHLAAIARSVDAGFRFLHLHGSGVRTVEAIHGERRAHGAVDTYAVRAPGQAVAARFREEDYPHGDPLWQLSGSVAEVVGELLNLPPHGAPGAPTRLIRASSSLWVLTDR